MSIETVLVVGSTGTQGGAVARNLLERDFDVQALTRDATSGEAHELTELGAEVVEGDIGEKNSVEPLIEECDGVFLMTNFWEHGYEDEVEQGTNVVELVDDHGVEHLVFSSVGGAERDTGIPHFDSKFEIEELIDERAQIFDVEDLQGFAGLESHRERSVLDRFPKPLEVLGEEDGPDDRRR